MISINQLIGSERSDGRRDELVRAAFQVLAEKGFEGLRTRDVAAHVGINPATLHYYFPTKEALIAGVLQHVNRRFARLLPTKGTPTEQLRFHLDAVRRMILEDPAIAAVLCELTLRGPRDVGMATTLRKADEAWFRKVRSLLEQGIAEGELPPDLDPTSAAAVVLAAIRGLCMPAGSSPDRIEQVFTQLQRWLGL